MAPDLGAQPGRVQADRVYPGTDEDVRNRLPVTDAEHLIAAAIIEYAQRPGPRRFHAEHHSSVAGPRGAMSAMGGQGDHRPATPRHGSPRGGGADGVSRPGSAASRGHRSR